MWDHYSIGDHYSGRAISGDGNQYGDWDQCGDGDHYNGGLSLY